ncbi:hypothetical protein ACPPVT_01085 [Angustibacter sp. McL0619]|uniref:hypothetical protein n=1 Tax=Angustibacter sp. McL0619 TaxID=3415676 RepID=UPI003CE80E71
MSTSDPILPETSDEQSPVVDQTPTAAAAPAAYPQLELVSRGIAFSVGAIPVGMLAAVLIWKLGYVGSISSLVIAAGAAFLYTKGAGAPPRKGLVPLILVVLVGVAASFFAIVASDLIEYYGTPNGQSLGYLSEYDFVKANIFNPDVLSTYGTDLAMFVLFAALGIFGTLRRMATAGRS